MTRLGYRIKDGTGHCADNTPEDGSIQNVVVMILNTGVTVKSPGDCR